MAVFSKQQYKKPQQLNHVENFKTRATCQYHGKYDELFDGKVAPLTAFQGAFFFTFGGNRTSTAAKAVEAIKP
jgi:hypothetical protein